jgi:hypothetical protein
MSNINFKGDEPVDFEGILELLRSMEGDCRICDHVERKKQGNLCCNCCMRSNSTYGKGDSKRSRVYPSSRVFKKFGLINLPAMGKHMLYHFLDHPELNFTYPPLPDEDLFGVISKEKAVSLGLDPEAGKNFLWHIHHENGNYWDDSEDNKMLCLNTEHPKFAARDKH